MVIKVTGEDGVTREYDTEVPEQAEQLKRSLAGNFRIVPTPTDDPSRYAVNSPRGDA